MVHKELEMHLIAYNLIRCLMVKLTARCMSAPSNGSGFKGATDAVRQFSPVIAQACAGKRRRALIRKLLAALAGDPVPSAWSPRAPSRQAPPQTLPIVDKAPGTTSSKSPIASHTC